MTGAIFSKQKKKNTATQIQLAIHIKLCMNHTEIVKQASFCPMGYMYKHKKSGDMSFHYYNQ